VALDWAGEQPTRPTLVAQARALIGLRLVAERLPAGAAATVRRLAGRLTVPILWPGARTRRLRVAVALLDARVARMIADRRARSEGRPDLLSLLLSARDEETGAAMPDRQVRDEVLTLFVAGHETTATGLSWALWLLARHPDVYAALRAEVDALGRVPTADDLRRLPLATRVFKEALRLYPPVYLFGRVAIADVDVGPYRLPSGTVVLISPFALHRRPELYPEPDRFLPERFLPEAESARPRSAYLPFSAGPRTCIGNHFALLEGPLVLATVLGAVDLETLPGHETVEMAPHATLRPQGSVPLRVRRRAR
jgi:cytochrome P450